MEIIAVILFVSFFAIVAGGLIAKNLILCADQTKFWSSPVAVILPLKMSTGSGKKWPVATA